MEKRKSITLADIVAKTKMVLGKYILVIKPLEATKELVLDSNELLKSNQGRRPTKRKIEKK